MAGRAKERTIRRAHHHWLDIVHGERARLYVHDQEQATLIANDLKTGAEGKGAVALWIDRGTVAHFRNLTVRPSSVK